MPYLRKVKIKGNDYFYLFHTVRDGNKFRKLSKYIGKEEPSKEELEILKKDFIKKPIETKKEKRPKANILGTLREIQEKHGCLPEDKIRELSKKLNIPVIDIYSAATFYSMLSVKKKGKNIVRICNSPSCYLNNSLNILEEAKKLLKIDINETTKDGKFTLELTSCIGCCDKAPAIMLNDELIGNITKEKLKKILK
jgi:NADH:ubiquinone oxidoreductase subunit E